MMEMTMIKHTLTRLAALSAIVVGTAGLAVAMPGSAHAANPPTQIILPALDTSAANPFGLALDAANWGGTGTSAICNPLSGSFGQGVVNDPVVVYPQAGAGCAADWQILPDATAGTFQIQYNPAGNTSANLCVSTIGNTIGVHYRLRPCAVGGNAWQTFTTSITPNNSDITGGKIIQTVAAPNLAANDQAFGFKLSPVIGWTPSPTHVNQIWTALGPALP
jgi:hypothetical protein